MSDYKPGTVARATVRGSIDEFVMKDDSGWWISPACINGDRYHGSDMVTDVRPLVLLDLDEAGSHLAQPVAPGGVAAMLRRTSSVTARKIAEQIEAQIEAQTKPPRIPEPDAIGSIVLAAQVGECDMSDRYWTKFRKDGWIDGYDHIRSWDDLDNPIHVREGVES